MVVPKLMKATADIEIAKEINKVLRFPIKTLINSQTCHSYDLAPNKVRQNQPQ